jgi:hypothetical protein
MSTISLRIPESLYKQVKSLVIQEHTSINHFVSTALAEKISALMTEDYLEARAKRASKEKFIKSLSKVPDVEAEEFDRL